MSNLHEYVVSNSSGKGYTREEVEGTFDEDYEDSLFDRSYAKAIQALMDDLWVKRNKFVQMMNGHPDWTYVVAEQRGKEASWPGTVYVHTDFTLDRTIYMRSLCILDVQGHEITLNLSLLGASDAAIECRTFTFDEQDRWCGSVTYPEGIGCIDPRVDDPDTPPLVVPHQIIARRGQLVNARFFIPHDPINGIVYRGAIFRISTQDIMQGNYHCIFKNIRTRWGGDPATQIPEFNGIEFLGFPNHYDGRSAHDFTFHNIQMDAVNIGIYIGIRFIATADIPTPDFPADVDKWPHCYSNGHLFQDVYFERCNQLVWIDRTILRNMDWTAWEATPDNADGPEGKSMAPYSSFHTFFNVRGQPLPGATIGVYNLHSGSHYKHTGPVHWLSETDSDTAREWVFQERSGWVYVCTHPLEGDVEWGALSPDPADFVCAGTPDECGETNMIFVTPARNLAPKPPVPAERAGLFEAGHPVLGSRGNDGRAVQSSPQSEPRSVLQDRGTIDGFAAGEHPIRDRHMISTVQSSVPSTGGRLAPDDDILSDLADPFRTSIDEAMRDIPDKYLPPFDEPGGGKSGLIGKQQLNAGAMNGYEIDQG